MVKRGERLTARTLTTNEKVLIHLKESPLLKDTMDAPYSSTQHGISESVGMRINHVSRAMKTLIREGFVEELSGRVRGEVRRRKIYKLTDRGISKSKWLKEKIASKKVILKKGRSLEELTLGEAVKKLGNISTMSLLRMVDSEGIIDVFAKKEKEFASLARGLPEEESFFGRKGEMAVLEEWLKSRGERILSLAGSRGIGKTTLASHAFREWASKRNTFWFSFLEWDTPVSFLEAFSNFLKEMGRPELKNYLTSARKIDMWEVSGATERGLAEDENVLFLDEFPTARKEMEGILLVMMETVARCKNTKMVITQDVRKIPRRESFLARGVLAEMDLLGLDKKSCEQLLSRKISSDEFEKIYRLTEGNPLHIKLMEAGKLEDVIDIKDYTPEELAILKYMKALKRVR